VPIYEYQCEHCGVFEEMQRITDPALSKCPKCRRKVRRLISSTSFQLKGTGWYVTDYARKNGKHGSSPSSKEKPADSDKASTKTETKAETKSVSETPKSS